MVSEEYAAPSPAPSRPPTPPRRLALPAALFLGGIAVLIAMDAVERAMLSGQVWQHALMAPDSPTVPEGTYPIRCRRLPLDSLPPESLDRRLSGWPGGQAVTDVLRFDIRESLVALDAPDEVWHASLAWGCMPRPGEPEVLAGPLCRFREFALDGATFHVVGGLPPATSGLALAFVLPNDAGISRFFAQDTGATDGWVDPRGIERLMEEPRPEWYDQVQELRGGLTPTLPAIALGTAIGLALAVIGGVGIQVRLLRALLPRWRPFRPMAEAIARHSRLFWGMNGLNFGIFIAFAFLAPTLPVMSARVTTIIADIFTKGELQQLGSAYAAGDILGAAWGTWRQNFIEQSLSLSLLPSLVVPFFGIWKNAISIAFAGFGIGPVWISAAGRLAFHSVTILIELEAYTIISFTVALYPLYLFRALAPVPDQEEPADSRPRVITLLLSGALLSAVILAIAALYEATTLTLFG